MVRRGRYLSIRMGGEDVRSLHTKLCQLGFSVKDRHGFFGKYTREIVLDLQKKHGLEATGIVDEATTKKIDDLLETTQKEYLFLVRGQVSHEYTGLDGVRVVALDKNIGGEKVLGEATTDANGGYEIRYNLALLRKRGKEKPDIQIKVTSPDDRRKILAVSTVRYNVGSEETINVVVPGDKIERPAEYQRITAELATHLTKQASRRDVSELKGRFAQIQENEKRQDITYLANKTGWDARMVAMVALANQFSEQSDIRPEFYYALFRARLPANEDVLSQTNLEMVQTLWNRAIDEKIIPEELKDEIPENLERFKTAGVGRLLEQSAHIGVSSLKELLGVSLGTDNDRKQRFAQLYYENLGDLTNFWNNVRHEFGDELADRLQLDGRLGFLTVNNGGLIERLHRDIDLHSPLDLVRNGLYKHDAWEDVLTADVAVPDEIPGKDAEERRANYVDFMVNQLRLSYPTAVVAEMIRSDEITLSGDPEVKDAVYQFLTDHQGRFELGMHPVEQYLRKHSVDLGEESLAHIKRLQRVYQISPSDEAMGKLLENKIDSAYAVVQYDEQVFLDKFKDDLVGETTARLIYAKSHQIHHAVLNIAINAKQWEWMKRYRVWEANRKVFLFPENWLEPELRDDKSPFFQDLESELLQSDITEDAAAAALVHYLEKLDEVDLPAENQSK